MSKLVGWLSAFVVGSAFLNGCVAATEDDAGALEGTDLTEQGVFGIAEGSPEAIGILKLVNTASYETLDATPKVGLTSTAAKAIALHRKGADGVEGTSDDNPCDTLTELDKVPYVGESAFKKLLAYAVAHGYVSGDPADPFDPASCAGPELEASEVLSTIAPGELSASLGFYGVFARSRTCNDVTGCTAWSKDSSAVATASGTSRVEVADAKGTIHVMFEDGGNGWCQHTLGSGAVQCSFGGLLKSPANFTFSPGALRKSCLTLGAKASELQENGIDRKETEVVLRAFHHAPIAQSLRQSPFTVNLACTHVNWGHQWTCQGAFQNTTQSGGTATMQVTGDTTVVVSDVEGPWGSSAEGTFALDSFGAAINTKTGSYPDSTRLEVLGDLVLYKSSYSANYGPTLPGCPSSGNSVTCTGVFSPGL